MVDMGVGLWEVITSQGGFLFQPLLINNGSDVKIEWSKNWSSQENGIKSRKELIVKIAIAKTWSEIWELHCHIAVNKIVTAIRNAFYNLLNEICPQQKTSRSLVGYHERAVDMETY